MSVRHNTNSFILGLDLYPDWFVLESQKGNVKYSTNQDGSINNVVITTPKGEITAKAGDTIMDFGDELVVVPSGAAKTYNMYK